MSHCDIVHLTEAADNVVGNDVFVFDIVRYNFSESLHSWPRCPARPDGDIRPEAILSTSFGTSCTAMHRQVTCTCQIWIPGWILPHFDVKTDSVASKLMEL